MKQPDISLGVVRAEIDTARSPYRSRAARRWTARERYCTQCASDPGQRARIRSKDVRSTTTLST